MTSISEKTAVVVGASSGVGRATAQHLVSAGARVIAVARGAPGLEALRAEAGDRVTIAPGDACDPRFAERVLREARPELVVLALGVHPHMAPVDGMTWEQFSEPWNVDLKAAFHWVKSGFQIPLAAGSGIAIVSSGAAIAGSPLSGGYAGAKRMQWLLASYAQRQSDARGLGIRVVAVLPTQLISGTKIADVAASTYGGAQGISASQYMTRWERPLDVDQVADAILAALDGRIEPGVAAIGVSGKGIEALP